MTWRPNPGPKVAGLDPSTKTGLCVVGQGDGKGPCLYNAEEVPVSAQLSGLPRAAAIAQYVIRPMVYWDVKLVAIEGQVVFKGAATLVLAEIQTLIRHMLWKHAVTWVEVTPSQLKKFTTGKGVAPKDVMRLESYKRWDFEHPSDNVVDAHALATVAAALSGLWSPTCKAQEEVLAKIKADGVWCRS